MLINVSAHARREYMAHGDLPALVQDITLLEFFQADSILALQQEGPGAEVPWYKRLLKKTSRVFIRLDRAYIRRAQSERTNDLFEMSDDSGETIACWLDNQNYPASVTKPSDLDIDWSVGCVCYDVIVLFDQPSGTSFIRHVGLTPTRRTPRQETKRRTLTGLFTGFDNPLSVPA